MTPHAGSLNYGDIDTLMNKDVRFREYRFGQCTYENRPLPEALEFF